MEFKILCACLLFGGLCAFGLCMTVPGLLPGWEMFVYFVIYWVLCTFASWECVDLLRWLRRMGHVEDFD